ncbi:uncharacterized protein LOC120176169 [Hibiscus syriacus]|uniref:uncharacterized protein LOC120176169 n=1 Tax=Hibiscus syriacus TaxID=106335 RepID=UPI0019229173|nr:uncharacterized protein LOC120176169 [Hibiscus syriacus]
MKGCSFGWLKSVLNNSLPVVVEDLLAGVITNAEIKDALFRQGKNKSHGPDGYTSWFFKVAWGIVIKDFIGAVRYFFQTSSLLPAFNATTIVLVRKSLNACMAKEFRLIFCCSVVYKTITRILVTRLVVFFPGMISLNQSTFVKGRNITDNTLLSQEVVRGASKKNLSPRCTIKVDLQKAFDSICWDLFMNVLEALGLPEGVRQGDPLSPYLSMIVMNVLSSLLDIAAKNGVFRFHPKCKRIPLTHICFADDLLLFCHESLDSVVVSILDMFYELSGLRLNAMKIKFFACGMAVDKIALIQGATCFRIDKLLVRYLGVPLVTRKLTSRDCSGLLVKIRDRISKWQLIFPKGVIRDVEKLCMRFFWRGNNSSARGARVSWNQMCSPKSEGGLGLRKLADWSKTCCLMLIKSILAEEGSLWIAWIKFSLVAWMVMLDRLPTKDRLISEIWRAVMRAYELQHQMLECWDNEEF